MPTWGSPTALVGSPVDLGRTNENVFVVGTFAAIANATLDSLHAYVVYGGVVQGIRAAVYAGGTSNSDWAGATLLEDLGAQNMPTSPGAWMTFTSTLNPVLPNAGRIWLAFRGAGIASYKRTASGDNGDLVQRCDRVIDAELDADSTVAWPSTATGAMSALASSALYSYITYTAPPAGPSAAAKRQYRRNQLLEAL